MGGGPRAEAGYYEMETSNTQVGGVPRTGAGTGAMSGLGASGLDDGGWSGDQGQGNG